MPFSNCRISSRIHNELLCSANSMTNRAVVAACGNSRDLSISIVFRNSPVVNVFPVPDSARIIVHSHEFFAVDIHAPVADFLGRDVALGYSPDTTRRFAVAHTTRRHHCASCHMVTPPLPQFGFDSERLILQCGTSRFWVIPASGSDGVRNSGRHDLPTNGTDALESPHHWRYREPVNGGHHPERQRGR